MKDSKSFRSIGIRGISSLIDMGMSMRLGKGCNTGDNSQKSHDFFYG